MASPADALAAAGRRAVAPLAQTLTDNIRVVLAVLRRVRQILVVKGNALITRANDVHAVLRDHEHFTVSHYEPKMAAISGPFILGLDDTQLYRRDHAALRAAIRAEDVPRIGATTLATARERVAAAGLRIDVVAELADPVIDRVMSEYFGTPGPDTAMQLRWARDIFQDVFLNVANGAAAHERALASAAEMRPHLDRLIAERRAAPVEIETRDGLREISHGRWEGLTRREVEERFGDEYAAWEEDPFTFAPVGGESGVADIGSDHRRRRARDFRMSRHPFTRIRVNQTSNGRSLRYCSMCRNTFTNASCTASSASYASRR
jgi:hypothetical protein